MLKTERRWSYARAGVSIDRGNELVRRIRSLARKTRMPGTVGHIGGFSGFFDPSHLKIRSPLLVGTTDGVGTKLFVAQARNRHDTVGVDLVAMCVNDLVTTGARPLFFLDYLACGRLDLETAGAILRGIVRGCKEAGCALIGGETAEMPGFYEAKRYDLAGFAVGIVDKSRVVNGEKVREGDKILGLASSGFHSNGYSLLRKLFSREEVHGRWGEILLEPTRIYVKPILSLLGKVRVKGIAHITGGAFLDKVPRIIPDRLAARLDLGSWPVPPIFKEVEKRGRMAAGEMYRTFNMGIGMLVIVSGRDLTQAKVELEHSRLKHWLVGEVVMSPRRGVKVVLGES